MNKYIKILLVMIYFAGIGVAAIGQSNQKITDQTVSKRATLKTDRNTVYLDGNGKKITETAFDKLYAKGGYIVSPKIINGTVKSVQLWRQSPSLQDKKIVLSQKEIANSMIVENNIELVPGMYVEDEKGADISFAKAIKLLENETETYNRELIKRNGKDILILKKKSSCQPKNH